MNRSGVLSRVAPILGVLVFAGTLLAPAQTPPSKSSAPAKQAPATSSALQVKLVPQMPPGAPAKPYRFPQAATKTLPNGLRVFVISSSKEPTVAARLVLTAAGAVNDPAGKPGVAAMTANLLTQGTEKHTAQEIAEAIDFVGGSLEASADDDAAYLTFTVVKKDFDLGMDLLSDITLHAAFKPEELDRRRQQLLSDLDVQYADPDYLASVMFDRVVFGLHPYGLPNEGTPDSVRALTGDDLARFRDASYVPNRALLAFAGDITPEAAFAAAEKYFGAWPQKEITTAEPAPPKRPAGLRIFLIDKPDAVQTQIRVGRIGIRRNDPDYIPLYVTNRIFGGGYNSRLNTEVRLKKGLTYSASASFDSRRLSGEFLASTSTRTEATIQAAKLIVDLIARMATGDVKPEELDFARDYLAGVFPIQTELPSQVAGRVLTVAQYGLPANYYDTYQERIRSVSVEQVKVMAASYYDAADLDLVFAGNASQFRDALKKAFPNVKLEEIPFDQVDVLAADLRRSKETAAPSPEALERGSAILSAATAAAGGKALSTIESVEISTTGKLFVTQGEFPTQAKAWLVYPDRIRVDTTLPSGVLQQGFDGKSGWLAGPQGAIDLPPPLNAEFQRALDLAGGLGIFRQALAGKTQMAFVGEEEIEGKKMLAAEWTTGTEKVKLYFDPESHLLAGARFRQATPQGPSDTLQVWSDYREVPGAGVKFPYHSINYRNGSKFTETTVSDLKLNTKPDPSLFTKPTK